MLNLWQLEYQTILSLFLLVKLAKAWDCTDYSVQSADPPN